MGGGMGLWGRQHPRVCYTAGAWRRGAGAAPSLERRAPARGATGAKKGSPGKKKGVVVGWWGF